VGPRPYLKQTFDFTPLFAWRVGVAIGADETPPNFLFDIYAKHLCGIGVSFQSGADSHSRMFALCVQRHEIELGVT
jgi:hypothetical protein